MKLFISIFLFFLITWLIGMCLFTLDAFFFNETQNSSKYENIVVLTGGENRIVRALDSIDTLQTKNIFISGVYKKSRLKDIIGNRKISDNICFILGKKAKNTQGNASEITEWTQKNNIKTILLVTSDYHMRRSIIEFKFADYNLETIPYPSKSKFNYRFIINCIKEFHKTIYTLIRNVCNSIREIK